MEKKLKRRPGDDGKTRISREEIPSQEDESDRPHDLEFIHQSLEVLDLAILSIHIKSTSCHNLLSNYH
jgi:hypothetical protein